MPFRNSKKAGLSAGTNPSGVRRWCEACATKYEGARPVSVSHCAVRGAGQWADCWSLSHSDAA